MEDRSKEITEIHATVVQCEWGGWLAVSEPGAVLQIGTVGDTEGEALMAFAAARREWARMSAERESNQKRSAS